MKTRHLLPLLGVALSPLASAELAHAVLVVEENAETVYIEAASERAVRYTSNPKSLNRIDKLRIDIQSIYFFEPALYREAMQQFESRNYKEARELFAKCKQAFEKIKELPGNYGTLAGFYELECARKMNDLAGLKQLLDTYQPASLLRECDKNQQEIYPLWDAVRSKSWPRLDSLAKEMLERKDWTGSHLAQIYYCHGLALEGLGRPTDALNAFNAAFTADYTASEVITRMAAENCLRILKNHDEVKLAMELWGTDDEDPNSTGYFLLQEAVALCDLWKKALGVGTPLPSEYSGFLGFRASDNPVKAKPAKKEEADEKAEEGEGDDKKEEK